MMVTVVMMVAITAMVGAIMAATPWIMPPTECFAVTVPPSAQHDARVRGYKLGFARAIGVATLACAVALAATMLRIGGAQEPTSEQLAVLMTVSMAAVLIPVALGFVLMLHYRARVRELKRTEGWKVDAPRAVAVVDEDVPQPISLAWNLLYVPLVLGMIAFGLRNYDRFPAQIPMNMSLDGTVSSYAQKSVGSVLFPAMVTTFMALVFVMTHVAILRSKRPVDPAAPTSSAYAYGRFARVQSQVMLVMGILLSAAIGVSFYLSALGVISLAAAGLAMGASTLVIVLAVMAVSLVTGQSGGRLAAELRTTDDLARDDDAYWPLGVFYANGDDPSIVVPKRFGVGWTINVARPAAWVAVAGLVAVVVAFTLLVNWAVGLPA